MTSSASTTRRSEQRRRWRVPDRFALFVTLSEADGTLRLPIDPEEPEPSGMDRAELFDEHAGGLAGNLDLGRSALGEECGRLPREGGVRFVGQEVDDRLRVAADVVDAPLVAGELGQLELHRRAEALEAVLVDGHDPVSYTHLR